MKSKVLWRFDGVRIGIYSILYGVSIILPFILYFKFSSLIVFILPFAMLVIGVALFFIYSSKTFERSHLLFLYVGNRALKIFLCSSIGLTVGIILYWILTPTLQWQDYVYLPLWVIFHESILFWLGIILVYLSSVQLGMTTRILGIVLGWIPIANIIMLVKILEVTDNELRFEYKKEQEYVENRVSEACATKYPILLVHGVFFRDLSYLNYWGRIPNHLARNGANIYYGNQASAASVKNCAKELANRIQTIISETGCEKVNVIAHSKGGLDMRYAISNFGMDQYVASLTTINTPHHGCIFANYLLGVAPKKMLETVAKSYNKTFAALGDEHPDFVAAVYDLTDESCAVLNQQMPNKESVMYQGYISYVNKASSGKFPLNVSYPIVKHFDGRNDGLVSLESGTLFDQTTIVHPQSMRGISHADMIDLTKENIDGFDVRQFYEDIVFNLKKQGY